MAYVTGTAGGWVLGRAYSPRTFLPTLDPAFASRAGMERAFGPQLSIHGHILESKNHSRQVSKVKEPNQTGWRRPSKFSKVSVLLWPLSNPIQSVMDQIKSQALVQLIQNSKEEPIKGLISTTEKSLVGIDTVSISGTFRIS